MAQSVIDYIFRVMGMEYLGRTDFVQVKPADEELEINQQQLRAAPRREPSPTPSKAGPASHPANGGGNGNGNGNGDSGADDHAQLSGSAHTPSVNPGNPDDFNGRQNKLHFVAYDDTTRASMWNDSRNYESSGRPIAYVLESVPEPSALALLAMGAFGLLVYAWRRRRRV